ncbi:MAG TPA: hypothetical protein VGE08_00145 [Steroidobacter sp.]|uniref:hypothetical protein n=1 Tax=Steroidobacter sp. TaxID=1978227 RepID=UPI002EDA03B8
MGMNLDERVRRTPLAPPPVDFDAVVKRSKRWYIIWWGAMPSVVAVAAFTMLCAKECIAMPWLTLLIAPVAGISLGILWGIVYWVKSSSLPDEHRGHTRRFILLSLLWGPILGLGVFKIAMMAATTGAAVLTLFI